MVALLNSKVINFYYRLISSQLGTSALRAFTVYVEQLPLPKISENRGFSQNLTQLRQNVKKMRFWAMKIVKT